VLGRAFGATVPVTVERTHVEAFSPEIGHFTIGTKTLTSPAMRFLRHDDQAAGQARAA